jgi:hypothetical protein
LAVTLTSSTQSPEEIKEALKANGYEVEDSKVEPAGDGKSEQSGKSGDTSATAKTGESDSASDPEKKESQETQAEGDKKPLAEEPTKRERPGRHDFKSKIQKQEERILKLADDLDLERGDRRRLQQKLEEALAELQTLKGGSTDKPKVDEGPVKPVRPVLADFEFDQEKYDLALQKYDDELVAYTKAMAVKEVAEEQAKQEQARIAKEAKETQAREVQAFRDRCQAEIHLLPDYEDLAEAMPTEAVPVGEGTEDAIRESDHPALLIHYFMVDVVDNGGVESKRFREMSHAKQIREITKLEQQLVAKLEKTAAAAPKEEPPAKPAVVTDAQQPEKTPARQRPQAKVPEEPIEPVGSRSGRTQVSLDQATNLKDFIRLRRQGVAR